MANETEYSNFSTVAAYVAANTAPHFRAASVMRPLITVEELQDGSNSKKFPKRGSLTAAVVAESTGATASEYTESASALTMQKAVVYVELSDEAEEFAGSESKLAQLAEEAGMACAEKYDTDAAALMDGFSNAVGSTGVDLSLSTFKSAAYTCRLNNVKGKIASVLHPTQVNDVQSDLITTAASVYVSETRDGLRNLQVGENGFRGNLLGIDVFETSNTKSINGDEDWAGGMFSPYAICSILRPSFKVNIGYNVAASLHELAVLMYYQVGEWKDEAGCELTSDQ